MRVIESEFDRRQVVGLCAVHLFLRRRRLCYLFQRGEQRVRSRLQRVLLADLRARAEQAGLLELKREGRRPRSQTRLHERLVQPARRLRAEYVRHDVQRREFFVRPWRHVIRGENELDIPHPPERHTALAILCRFCRIGREQLVRAGPVRAWNAAEIVNDQVQCVIGIEAAGHDQDRVVRLVVLSVERLQPVDGHLLDIRPSANGGVAVVVPIVRGGHDALLEHPRGIVFAPLPLVAHHGHLRFEVLRGDEGIDHAVRFQVECPLEVVVRGWERLVIVGPIKPGSAVGKGPALGQLTGDIRMFWRSLEDEVLQQVRHACLPIALVTRANQVGDIDCDLLLAPVWEKKDPESVAEPVFGDALHRRNLRRTLGYRRRVDLGRRCGGAGEQGGKCKDDGGRPHLFGSFHIRVSLG